jgi:hypothetical protein
LKENHASAHPTSSSAPNITAQTHTNLLIEHSIIVVMASVSFGAAYATDILLAQIAFYKQDFGIVFQLLLVISTQSIGYGIAGMMRKFLVYVSQPSHQVFD